MLTWLGQAIGIVIGLSPCWEIMRLKLLMVVEISPTEGQI